MPEDLGFNQSMSNQALNNQAKVSYLSIASGYLYRSTIKDYLSICNKGKEVLRIETLF